MFARTGRFRRSDRLLDPRDFRRLGADGERQASRSFVLLAAPARLEGISAAERPVRRLGITASRKVGNSVVRNHVKRRVREWFRTEAPELADDVDLVVIARRGAGSLATAEIADELRRLAARSRILTGDAE